MNTNTPNKKSKIILPIIIVAVIVAAMAFVLYNNKKEINKNAAVVPQGVSATPVKIAAC